MNQVILIGHIGQNPTVRSFDSGRKVASFTLATNEKFGDQERTSWHNIVAWGYLAERDLRKGDKCMIRGYIQTRDYEQDGDKKRITEIVALDLQRIDNRYTAKSTPTPDDDPFATNTSKEPVTTTDADSAFEKFLNS
jgi:single-strand DNA-binding protein